MKEFKLIPFVAILLLLLMISIAGGWQTFAFQDLKKQEIIRIDDLKKNIKINSISFNGSMYIAVGCIVDEDETNLSGVILTSDNGLKWKQLEVQNVEPLYDVKWCGNKFIAVGGSYFLPYSNEFSESGEAVYISNNGLEWERRISINSYMPFYKLEWNGEMCVAIGGKFAEGEASGVLAYSKDGVEWSAVGGGPYYTDEYGKNYYDNQPLLNDLKFINEKFIAVGQEILVSENGIEWKTVKQNDTDNISPYFCISVQEEKAIVIGKQKIYYTTDFENWEEVDNSNIKESYKQIIFNGSYYLISGNMLDKTVVLKSFDLISWEKISEPIICINNILWDGEKYLIGANNGIYTSFPNDIIKVKINGKKILFDVPPQLINDRSMVPMRKIFEAMGATVDWNDSTQTVTAKKDDIVIIMQIDNVVISVSGKEIALDVPPQIVDSRTLVPVRAVAEGLDADVKWDGETNTVLINTK